MKFMNLFQKKPSESTKSQSSTKQGLPKGKTRTTIVVTEISLEKLKSLAFINKSSTSKYVDQAIQTFIQEYEKENGEIQILR